MLQYVTYNRTVSSGTVIEHLDRPYSAVGDLLAQILSLLTGRELSYPSIFAFIYFISCLPAAAEEIKQDNTEAAWSAALAHTAPQWR